MTHARTTLTYWPFPSSSQWTPRGAPALFLTVRVTVWGPSDPDATLLLLLLLLVLLLLVLLPLLVPLLLGDCCRRWPPAGITSTSTRKAPPRPSMVLRM